MMMVYSGLHGLLWFTWFTRFTNDSSSIIYGIIMHYSAYDISMGNIVVYMVYMVYSGLHGLHGLHFVNHCQPPCFLGGLHVFQHSSAVISYFVNQSTTVYQFVNHLQ